MGYLDETKAMKKRSERNRGAWQPHLDRNWNIAPIGDDKRFLSKELAVGAWFFRGNGS